MIEYLLTLWTIRLSLLCYFLAFASWLGVSTASLPWQRRLRAIWTAGLLLLLAHIGAVFHFVHHWRHDLAVRHTAQETLEVIGREFGSGVYFNYLFAMLWSADVVWWWLAPASHQRRSRICTTLLHAYLLFIVINSVIVFETGMLRWCGILAVLVLLVIATRRLLPLTRRERVP